MKVFEHLTDYFVDQTNTRETKMLRNLPPALHGVVAMDTFLEFVVQIPWIQVFLEREPELVRELCRGIEIRTVTQNNFVFSEGFEGIYFVDRGIVAIEGRLYMR